MLYINKRFQSLRIVGKPAKHWKDKNGNPKKSDAEDVQFLNGEFDTKNLGENDLDPKKAIAIVEKYMKENPGEITVVDPKDVEREARIRKEVEKKVAAEIAAEKKQNPPADKFGKQLNKKDEVPGEYPSEEEIDKTEISKGKIPDDMSKKELLKWAKKNDLPISRKERKDVEVLRGLVKGHFYAAPEAEGDAPDLTDESEGNNKKE